MFYTGKYNEIVFIDYDLRIVQMYAISKDYTKYKNYGFFVNDDGFISQIGTCELTYKDGYLISVECPNAFGQLIYDSNEIIKASLSNLIENTITIYYITYGNNDKQGGLLINILCNDKNKLSYLKMDDPNVASFIAYQSGLFGKVTKSSIHLKSEREMSSFIKEIHDRNSNNFQLVFKCE